MRNIFPIYRTAEVQYDASLNGISGKFQGVSWQADATYRVTLKDLPCFTALIARTLD
jgi:hypothetical protein